MRHHPDRLDIVALGGLEAGVAEQVRRDADLLGRAVDQLGHGAIPEQVWPDRIAEGFVGSGFDLGPDRAAAHRPLPSVEPEVAADSAHLALSHSNCLDCFALNLKPTIDARGQLEENGGTTQAVPAARWRPSSSATSRRFARVPRAGRADHQRCVPGPAAWSNLPYMDDGDLIKAPGALEPVWDQLYPAEQARILRLLIERIDVAPTASPSRCMLRGFAASSRSWRSRRRPPWPKSEHLLRCGVMGERIGLELDTPMRLQRRGGRKLIMTPEGVTAPARKARRDDTLIKALVRAHRWRRQIESRQAKSITDLAEQEGVTDAYVCRLLPLTRLAPDIVEAILDGR
jgi:hypothetical protein